MVQHQHCIAGIGLGAETVVGQGPEGAISHGLDAGEALQRLALEGQGQAGHACAVLARKAAKGFGALAAGCELAGAFQKIGCIIRCWKHAVGRDDRLRYQLGGKGLFFGKGRRDEGGGKSERGKKQSDHGCTCG